MTTKLPYVGYDKPRDEWTAVTKISEAIHRLRRGIALHSFLYYEESETVITDYEYEFRVKKLLHLQKRFPKIAKSVRFMRAEFLSEDFESTSYHIGQSVRQKSMGASRKEDHCSIYAAAQRLLEQGNKSEPFQSGGATEFFSSNNKNPIEFYLKDVLAEVGLKQKETKKPTK